VPIADNGTFVPYSRCWLSSDNAGHPLSSDRNTRIEGGTRTLAMAGKTNESANSSSLSLAHALGQGGAAADQNAEAQASPRTDAIGIEIPVVLYASRYSAAGRGVSKAPPPVREETRTVIVFAQGAVVRLTATLSVGEMVVLTNQHTGADVLCRVGAVKTQPGVQNYVDLEFTQRAPGFWEDRLAAGTSARSEGPTFESPMLAPQLTKQESGSPSWLSTEPVLNPGSLSSGSTPASRPAPSTMPSTPFAIESPRGSSAGTGLAMPQAANAALGPSASRRAAQSDPLTFAGGQMDWTRQSPPKSKKGIWVAAAAVVVAGVLAGGFLLIHHRGSTSPASGAGITVAAPSAPVQPSDSTQTDAAQAATDAESTPSTAEGPVEKPRWVPDTPKHEEPQAEAAHAEDGTQPTAAPALTPAPAAAPRSTPQPPASRRPTIPVGNLAAPIAKAPVTASSNEPPPVLVAQDNGAAEGVLRSGVLSGASGVEAPTAFPGVVIPTVRPSGGRIQMPKLISSPDPKYPAAARSQSAEGVVAMDALVDATGKVTEVKVISGPTTLREAAADAVRKWKYEPARLDGLPTAVHTNVSITFKLR
jgi:protein TonB